MRDKNKKQDLKKTEDEYIRKEVNYKYSTP